MLPVYAGDVATLRTYGGFLVRPRQCDRGEFRFGVRVVNAAVRAGKPV